MIQFTVKGIDKAGKVVAAQHYDTQKLHTLGGHWGICRRMANTILKSRKVVSVAFYMDGIQYAWDDAALEWLPKA